MTSQLDLLPLEKAARQLKKNYAKAQTALAAGNLDDFDSFRTAAIKGFELAFELGKKFILRGLEETGEDIDNNTEYRKLLRLAVEKRLISDPEIWYTFRQERNRTTHVYDEQVAQEFYLRMPVYIEAVEQLLAGLKR